MGQQGAFTSTLATAVLFFLTGCGNHISYHVESLYGVNDRQFVDSMSNVFGSSMIAGNQVATLVDGQEIYPAMLEAIRSAKRTITFETYIFSKGEISSRFTRAFCERARAGVRVHVILDAIGSGDVDPNDRRAMREAGVELHFYHDWKWWRLSSTTKFNYRTHRKLMIVDGREGFIGGAGVSDYWLDKSLGGLGWRDCHYHVQGPVVAQLQASFMRNWLECSGKILHGSDYFPPLEPRGDVACQVLSSSSNNYDETIQLAFLMAIAAADKHIRIAAAYFVPDEIMQKQLMEARRRGVRVQVIIPSEQFTDSPLAQQSSRAKWGALLDAGIEIYIYQHRMHHVKMMIIDDAWVSIGSANMDNRSFKLNDEVNMNVLDRDFAAVQIAMFEADLEQSMPVNFEEWNRRSLLMKIMDGISTLLDPIL